MEKRTKTYLTMAHMGLLSTLGLLAAVLLNWPDFVKGLMIGMLLIPLLIAPLRRMRDEYIESLWRAGTAWAFITMVALFLMAPFLQGVWDGYNHIDRHSYITAGDAGYAAILMFFVGFHVEWLRARL